MSYIHPRAVVLGDVVLGDNASVWPCAVLRADSERITVGAGSNIQDGTVIHVDPGIPCTIGERVTVGHRAIIHGATIEDECLIGMGAIVLNRAVVGRGSVVAAGAVVLEDAVIPPGSVVVGIPGKVVRQVDAAMRERTLRGVQAYIELQRRHKAGEFKELRSYDRTIETNEDLRSKDLEI